MKYFVMGLLHRRTSAANTNPPPMVHVPLDKIQFVCRGGIRYTDQQGRVGMLRFADAYKGWCRRRKIRSSKPRYVCDRTRAEERQMIFYTVPQVIFHGDRSQEVQWAEVLAQIRKQGYAAWDAD